MNKTQIFTNLTEFLTKYEKNQVKKVDYRAFWGNVRASLEWVKRKELTEQELSASKEIKTLLDTWQNNYSSKLGISEEVLRGLSKELTELLTKYQTTKPKEKKEPTPAVDNLTKKLEQVEEGFKWLEWYEKHKSLIKGVGIVIIILFAWLVIRAFIETFIK